MNIAQLTAYLKARRLRLVPRAGRPPVSRSDPYLSGSKYPNLCPGSLDTPEKSFMRFGFCQTCHVKVKMRPDGLAQRHEPTTGFLSTRWN